MFDSVYLNPVAFGVLQVDLTHPVCPQSYCPGLSGPVPVGHIGFLEMPDKGLQIADREAQVFALSIFDGYRILAYKVQLCIPLDSEPAKARGL